LGINRIKARIPVKLRITFDRRLKYMENAIELTQEII
jgi:hypothetical protein